MVSNTNLSVEKQPVPPQLTPWQPGQSGNPNGRPKNSVTTLLKNQDAKTTQEICDKLIELAKEGDLPAIKEYLDRTDGKVTQPTDHTFDGEGLLSILGRLRGNQAPMLEEREDATEQSEE
ncbi:hypothetical protein LCGC14_1288250 [marine sediment metagenome]|uniref:DUF5681 domain-containing protein n=1 Tax=marine sediment metagenome TaxID=412755 RepID=A0A0F9KUV7_9ZZZZ